MSSFGAGTKKRAQFNLRGDDSDVEKEKSEDDEEVRGHEAALKQLMAKTASRRKTGGLNSVDRGGVGEEDDYFEKKKKQPKVEPQQLLGSIGGMSKENILK